MAELIYEKPPFSEKHAAGWMKGDFFFIILEEQIMYKIMYYTVRAVKHIRQRADINKVDIA